MKHLIMLVLALAVLVEASPCSALDMKITSGGEGIVTVFDQQGIDTFSVFNMIVNMEGTEPIDTTYWYTELDYSFVEVLDGHPDY